MFASAHVSLRILMPPQEACSALQGLHDHAVAREPFRMHKGASGLWLSRQRTVHCDDPLRIVQLPGRLWVSPWPVRVRLECSAWSDNEAELGIQPIRLNWPVCSDRYCKVARTALAELATSLTHFKLEPRLEPSVAGLGVGS
jgi:hypothetical protein